MKRLIINLLKLSLLCTFMPAATLASEETLYPVGRPLANHASHPGPKERVPAAPKLADGPYIDFSPIPSGAWQTPSSTDGADTTVCKKVTYYHHELGSCDFVYRLHSQYRFPKLAMRFDGPQAPNTVIKVKGVVPYIWRTSEGSIADGAVRITAEVWTDLGGLPDSMVYAETFALPIIADTGGYFDLPFSNPPLMSGSYHIALGADLSGPDTDTLFLRSDFGDHYALTGCPASGYSPAFRSSRYLNSPAGWYPQQDVNGFTSDFDMYSDFCQVYSSCYTQLAPSNGYVSLYQVPDPSWECGSRLTGFGQRFDSPGPDTVVSIDFLHYDYSQASGPLYPANGTNSVEIALWKDDGTGNIDYSQGPIAQTTIPGGRASLFPETGGNESGNGWNYLKVKFPTPPVVLGPWHVTARMTSSNPADGVLLFPLNSTQWDPGRIGGSVSFTAPEPLWKRTGSSNCWTLNGENERAFLIYVDLCRNEFSSCQSQAGYTAGTSVGYRLPLNIAQRFDGQPVNQIEKIRIQLVDPASFGENGGSPNLLIKVWSGSGAYGPGQELASYSVPSSGLSYYPGWTELSIPGGLQVASSSFFVGYQLDTTNSVNSYLLYGIEENQGPMIRGGAWFYSTDAARWQKLSMAPGRIDNAVIDVDFCSIESPSVCGVPDDYATAGHDFGRTGHANVAVGDAYCNLTYKWGYADPNAFTASGCIGSAGPIVFDTFVVCEFGTKYQIFSLNTGALLKTITGPGAPYYISNSGGLACIPTVALVTLGGNPTHVLFVGGGSTNSIDAFNMDDPSLALIWSLNPSSGLGLGFNEAIGNTSFANFVVLTVGGIDRLYFCTGGGRIYNVVAATGHRGTWGPTFLPGPTYRGLASDGQNLFVSQAAAPPVSLNGDVYSLNATTGALNWQLSSSGGLKGDGSVYAAGTYGPETFPSGLAVSGGEVYTVSATMNARYSVSRRWSFLPYQRR